MKGIQFPRGDELRNNKNGKILENLFKNHKGTDYQIDMYASMCGVT